MRTQVLGAVLLASGAMGWAQGVPTGYREQVPAGYREQVLAERETEARALTAPDSWLSLVALKRLTDGELTVGAAEGNGLRLAHGAAHAFTLRVAGEGAVTLVTAAPGVTLGGGRPVPGAVLPVSEDAKATLAWDGLYAYAIKRTGNETYLRVGDHRSPDLVGFHGLKFYPVDPAYRVRAKWVPYAPAHTLEMPTVLGTVLKEPSPGYAEFVLDGQRVRLEATGDDKGLGFSFLDGTAKTTTYGAGRHVRADAPAGGVKAEGVVVIDFNRATNWPCAYTAYGTCPLPPVGNRFGAEVRAGEKRYHE